MLFVLGVFLSYCVVDPAGDGSTSRTEEHFPDAAGAASEWQSSVNVYHLAAGELYWFQSLWSALLTARESFPSGHGRPSAVPETQVCFWVRERTPGYVVNFSFPSTHCLNCFNYIFGRMSWHLDIVLLCVKTSVLFFFSSALMHQSNNVDSRRCYQCVKFLVTLAQKYVHMQST